MNRRATSPVLACTCLGLLMASGSAGAQTLNPPPPAPTGQPGVESDGDGINDDVDAEPCNVRVSAKSYEPGDRSWGMLLFEDRWPDKGDFDFNDLVLAYNEILDYDSANVLTGLRVDLRVVAVGARYTNGLALRIPGAPKSSVTFMKLDIGGVAQNVAMRAAETDVVIDLTQDLHALFGATSDEWINTDPSTPAKPYVDIVLELRFGPGQGISASQAPFDLFIFNPTRGTEVHRPEYMGTSAIDNALFGTADDGSTATRRFVTTRGIPFALELPEASMYPKEGVAIDQLYPAIVQFGEGIPGSETFYQNPQLGHAFGNISLGELTATPVIDVSCFTPNPGVCGAAANLGSVDAPSAGLCAFGTASVVTAQSGFHTWSCTGNYSNPTTCDAPDWVCEPGLSSSCSIANGAGTQVCNGSGTGYGACTLSSCNSGFFVDANQCTAQVCTPNATQSCAIPNGTGSQQCNNLGSRWHDCALTACNPGFTPNGGVCQAALGGGDVYYLCAGGSNYLVFVKNTSNLVVNSMRAHYDACVAYGFKAAGSRDNNHIVNQINYSASNVLDATGCNCCRAHSYNPWWWNYTNGGNGSADDCVHVAGSAPNAAGQVMSVYIPDFVCANHSCQTFKQGLGPNTYFGDYYDDESHEPWYPSASDPNCRSSGGDHTSTYSGVPGYLLCASASLSVR